MIDAGRSMQDGRGRMIDAGWSMPDGRCRMVGSRRPYVRTGIPD
jgi:hypothetical protein